MQMPLREMEKGPWEGRWCQGHLPRGGGFADLKVLAQVRWDRGARLGVRWRLKGEEPVGEDGGGGGEGGLGGPRDTHEKPGSAGSNPSRAGGALQLRFRGGASPA